MEQQKCIEFIKSKGPVIELIEDGGKLSYRCLACVSRGQPHGKVNLLGKADIRSVEYYLNQHLQCATHVKKMFAWKQRNDLEGVTKEASTGTGIKCPGYIISSQKNSSSGTLHLFEEEFKLWATHSMVTGKTDHTYWCDISQDVWFARSDKCNGDLHAGQKEGDCCHACQSLGEPQALLRYVLKFAFKYHAAILLKKRLFHSEKEVEEHLAMISKTAFASRCYQWEKVHSLSNIELQQYVRQGFATISPEKRSQNLQNFMDSSVAPVLQVNACSVDNKAKALFSHFAVAVRGHQLSDLSEVNLKIAEAVMNGMLDAKAFCQGLLVQCLNSLDKEKRGITSNRGRTAHRNDSEAQLIHDATMTLAISGGNAGLARELGMKITPPRIALGLPNPCMALTDIETLQQNVLLVDQSCPRAPGHPVRRLIMKYGLIGGAWTVDSAEDTFVETT